MEDLPFGLIWVKHVLKVVDIIATAVTLVIAVIVMAVAVCCKHGIVLCGGGVTTVKHRPGVRRLGYGESFLI